MADMTYDGPPFDLATIFADSDDHICWIDDTMCAKCGTPSRRRSHLRVIEGGKND